MPFMALKAKEEEDTHAGNGEDDWLCNMPITVLTDVVSLQSTALNALMNGGIAELIAIAGSLWPAI
jgi:hypothetical protein